MLIILWMFYFKHSQFIPLWIGLHILPARLLNKKNMMRTMVHRPRYHWRLRAPARSSPPIDKSNFCGVKGFSPDVLHPGILILTHWPDRNHMKFYFRRRALREIWRTHPSVFLQISRSATWTKTTRKVTFGLIYKPVTSILNINITLTHGIMLIILTVNSMLHTSWSDGKMSRLLIIPESIHFYCFHSKILKPSFIYYVSIL